MSKQEIALILLSSIALLINAVLNYTFGHFRTVISSLAFIPVLIFIIVKTSNSKN